MIVCTFYLCKIKFKKDEINQRITVKNAFRALLIPTYFLLVFDIKNTADLTMCSKMVKEVNHFFNIQPKTPSSYGLPIYPIPKSYHSETVFILVTCYLDLS